MSEINHTAAEALRAEFGKRAMLPKKQLDAAEKFMASLTNAANHETLKKGHDLLQKIEDKTSLFLFSAAVLAGQEAVSESDLERRLAEIDEGVERAERTAERLRVALASLSAA